LNYLSNSLEFKTKNLFSNAKQILAQYLTKADNDLISFPDTRAWKDPELPFSSSTDKAPK